MNFDAYMIQIAQAVSKNSKCLSRQIGAVLVRDKRRIGHDGWCRG